MSNQERQIAIIQDVVLSVDFNNRYDLYFTDKRVAIVCMGLIDRYGYDQFGIYRIPSSTGAVTPPLTYVDERNAQLEKMKEELGRIPLDDILKLSKKSCYYTFEEIETLKLGWGKKPKFVILSADCESKLTPNQEQFTQLIKLLTSTEPLRNKLEVAGNWKDLKEILTKVVCGSCGFPNDFDSVCCVNCGQEILEIMPVDKEESTCGKCGKKNIADANFCKQCGTALNTKS